MSKKDGGLNRRKFLKAGLQATAGAAALTGGMAQAAMPKDKKVTLSGSIPTRVLGKTGLEVPVLGLGGAYLVERWGAQGSIEERAAMVRRAYDRGVRWFDTADNYMESEEIVGAGLKDVRDNVYLATKVSVTDHREVRKFFERSLERFQTDYVDCIQIHGTTGIEQMTFEEAMKTHGELVKLRDEGLARFIGVTGHNYFDKIYPLIATGEFDTAFLANGYFKCGMMRLLTNEMVEMREMCLEKARELGMGVLAMKVLRGGMFGRTAESVTPDWDREKLERLPGAAIRYLFQDEGVHVFNIGVRVPSEVDDNVNIFCGDLTFTDGDRMLLAEFSAKAYPWYEEMMKKRTEEWQRRRAQREKKS